MQMWSLLLLRETQLINTGQMTPQTAHYGN
jgi:hypothetical protein